MNRFRKHFKQEKTEQEEQHAPLRDFKTKREKGDLSQKKVLKQERKVRITIFSAVALICIAVWAYIAINFYGEGEASKEVGERFPLGDAITAEGLFQAFVKSNFGQQSPERLNTIRVSGTIRIGDNEQEFLLYKKQPDMALLVLDAVEGTLSYGMEGDTVWQKLEAPDGAIRVGHVTGESAEKIKEVGHFFTPFTQYALTFNGLDPALEIDDKRKETGHIEVSFTDPFSGMKARAEIDGKTLHVRHYEKFDDDGNSTKAIFKDYETADGFQIPRTMEYYLNGTPTQTVRIERAVTNSGVLSDLFKVPPNL